MFFIALIIFILGVESTWTKFLVWNELKIFIAIYSISGTLSSVTNFAGSWARTLNRFTLDADDLLQAEQIRRVPPTNIAEGILQGLSEFGISLLGETLQILQ